MRKAVVLLLLVSVAFSMTLEQAIQRVAELKITRPGEHLDSKPPTPVIANGKEYYVVDVFYAGKIVTMVVVGEDILLSEYAKEIMRTHYIAYHFYTDQSIRDLLDNLKERAADWEGQLSQKYSTYYNIIKPQLNTSFTKETACLNSMQQMISWSEGTQERIISINFTIKTLNDAERIFDDLDELLSEYLEYLEGIETLMDNCDAFIGEVISSDLKNTDPNLVSSIVQTVSIEGREYLPEMRNNIQESRKNIQEFYESTGEVADTFYSEFLSRYNQTQEWKDILTIKKRFDNYTQEYYYIAENYYKLKSKKDFERLEEILLNVSKALNSSEYSRASELLDEAEKIIAQLKEEIEEYSPSTGEPPEPQEPNQSFLLIGILVIVLVVLAFVYKRMGESHEENDTLSKYFDYE